MTTTKTPMLHIRKTVLRLSQAEMAIVAGKVSQGTVSKWEAGELEPDREQLALIRAEVLRRELPWDDGWFFEAPPTAPTDVPEPAKAAS